MVAKFKWLFGHLSIHLVTSAVIVLSMAVCSHAQDEHRWTANVGGGVSPLVGDISKRLDNGWHITVGGGLNVTRHLETTLEYSYNGYGVGRKVLNEAQVPDGNSHLWSLTVNPKLRLNRRGTLTPMSWEALGTTAVPLSLRAQCSCRSSSSTLFWGGSLTPSCKQTRNSVTSRGTE